MIPSRFTLDFIWCADDFWSITITWATAAAALGFPRESILQWPWKSCYPKIVILHCHMGEYLVLLSLLWFLLLLYCSFSEGKLDKLSARIASSWEKKPFSSSFYFSQNLYFDPTTCGNLSINEKVTGFNRRELYSFLYQHKQSLLWLLHLYPYEQYSDIAYSPSCYLITCKDFQFKANFFDCLSHQETWYTKFGSLHYIATQMIISHACSMLLWNIISLVCLDRLKFHQLPSAEPPEEKVI